MSTFLDLQRRVFRRLQKNDGLSLLAIKEGLNIAARAISRAKDFDELIAYEKESAATVADQSEYHWVDDWALERPKDIIGMRYMDGSNSRKLKYVSPSKVDTECPDPSTYGSQPPTHYTRRGTIIEIFLTPSEAKQLYITYSQWPKEMENDQDESPYPDDVDDVLVILGYEVAKSIVDQEEEIADWTPRAKVLLSGAIMEESTRPDQHFVAQPFDAGGSVPTGEYWNNPFVKRNP